MMLLAKKKHGENSVDLFYEKNEKIVKTKAPFLARYGQPWTPKRSKNDHFAQRIVSHFPWDNRRFRPESPIPNAPKKHFFYLRSYSKGPNHALESPKPRNTLYAHSNTSTVLHQQYNSNNQIHIDTENISNNAFSTTLTSSYLLER